MMYHILLAAAGVGVIAKFFMAKFFTNDPSIQQDVVTVTGESTRDSSAHSPEE